MPEIILGKREFRLSGAEQKHLQTSLAASMDARIEKERALRALGRG